MKNKLLLFGAGGHAKGIIEILVSSYKDAYDIVGITDADNNKIGKKFLGISVIGNDDIAAEYFNKNVKNAFITLGTVGNCSVRLNLYYKLKTIGYEFINICHDKAIISQNAVIGNGNVFMAGSIVNSNTRIGNNCIINTGAIVEHDCAIGNNVHIATGAKLTGGVTVEDDCMIGAGATIIQGITIGKCSIIGAGSVVIHDVPPYSVVVGVPGKVIKGR